MAVNDVYLRPDAGDGANGVRLRPDDPDGGLPFIPYTSAALIVSLALSWQPDAGAQNPTRSGFIVQTVSAPDEPPRQSNVNQSTILQQWETPPWRAQAASPIVPQVAPEAQVFKSQPIAIQIAAWTTEYAQVPRLQNYPWEEVAPTPPTPAPPAAQNTGSAGGGGGFQRQTGKINREHRLLEIERALEKTDEQDLTDILSMIAKTWVH